MTGSASDKPLSVNNFDRGLPHERTTLAWERTSIAMMVAGAALARYASLETHLLLGGFGVAELLAGGLLLAWATRNGRLLHDPDRPASAVPQLTLTRLVGAGTTVFTGVALLLAILVVSAD